MSISRDILGCNFLSFNDFFLLDLLSSGLTPGSVHSDCSWWNSGVHMKCRGLSLVGHRRSKD